MKKCSHCSREAADEVLVCPVCGSIGFESITEQTSSFNPYNYVPYQGEIKAKMKPWQILLVVLGCAAIIATAVFALRGIFDMSGYTEGEIVDGVYLNEWAEIKLVIPDDFDDLTDAEKSEYEDNYNDCGMVIESDNTSLVLIFENIQGAGISSTNEYIDLLHVDFKSDSDLTLQGMNIGEVFGIEIGEKQFKAFKNTPSDNSFCQYLCAYKKDNRMIVFVVTAMTESQIKDILSQVEFYSVE